MNRIGRMILMTSAQDRTRRDMDRSRGCSHKKDCDIIKKWNKERAIRANQRVLSQAAETSQNQQPGRIECGAIRSGKWVQMEEPAQRIRRLARDLCPDKPLGEKGSFGKSIFAFAATGNHQNPSKRGQFGFHLHQGSS